MAYTLEDLREIHAREYRQEPTGSYTINRNGRRVPVTHCVEYVTTNNAGRMPLCNWLQLTRDAIAAEGKQELFERIKEHCRTHCAWLHKETELEEYSLSCLSSGAYEHWEDFMA